MTTVTLVPSIQLPTITTSNPAVNLALQDPAVVQTAFDAAATALDYPDSESLLAAMVANNKSIDQLAAAHSVDPATVHAAMSAALQRDAGLDKDTADKVSLELSDLVPASAGASATSTGITAQNQLPQAQQVITLQATNNATTTDATGLGSDDLTRLDSLMPIIVDLLDSMQDSAHPKRRQHRLGIAAAAKALADAGVTGPNGAPYTVADLETEMQANGGQSIDDVARAHGVDPNVVHQAMAAVYANGDGLGMDPAAAAIAAATDAAIKPSGAALTAKIPLNALAQDSGITLPITG